MNTALAAPVMTGEEIVALIGRLERDSPIGDKKTLSGSKVDDFSYAIDKFPEAIRQGIGERIQANGLKEAAAIKRAVMSTKRDYASAAFYLECVEAFLRINSYKESQKYVSPSQVAQFEISDCVESMELDELEGDELEARHYELATAAYLLKTLDIRMDRYRVRHDYHVDVELVRVNLHRVMGNLDVIMAQDYKLVPTKAMARLVVGLATHTGTDAERIVRMVVERDYYSDDLVESLMVGNAAPLDVGVL